MTLQEEHADGAVGSGLCDPAGPATPGRVRRVFHLVISLAPGGLERMVLALTDERNRRSPASTFICCLDEPGMLAAKAEGETVFCLKAERSRFPFDLAAVRRMKEKVVSGAGERAGVEEYGSIGVSECGRAGGEEYGSIGVSECGSIGEREKAASSTLAPCDPDNPRTSAHATPPLPYSTTPILPYSSTPLPPVILHAHNMAAWQYAVLAAWGTRAKVLYTQHGANIHNRGFGNRLRSMFLAWFTDRIVAVSASTARAMAERQGIARKRIEVIPNGVKMKAEVGSRKSEVRGRLGIPGDAFVVGSVGRFSPEKNYPLLVRAFASFHAKQPGRFLVLVGDGPERAVIERTIRECGLANDCLLPGMQADVEPWLRAMDVFCLSSSTEGLSLSLLEAGAQGLPGVATDVGGNAEIVKEGVTGRLVPPGNGEAIAAALEELCGDRVLCDGRGREARRRITECFSLGATVEAYEAVYASL